MHKISDHGSLASGAFDERSQLYFLWSEQVDQNFEVKFARWVEEKSVLEPVQSLTQGAYALPEKIKYIGAYQCLFFDKNFANAFWVDHRESISRLVHTRLEFSK